MRTNNLGEFHIRKWYLQVEDTMANETGLLADGDPVRKIVIAAAIHNSHSGRFVADLGGSIRASRRLARSSAGVSATRSATRRSPATARPAWWALPASTSTATPC